MFNTKEKKERSLGIKLGLKAHRCNSPKCVLVRNPLRPGQHGKARRRAPSEFGQQLLEKQKMKAMYGVRDRQFQRIFEAAAKHVGATGEMLLKNLEKRLDNVVYRLGLAPSRSVARQLVNHGHILVNGRKTNISSYKLEVDDMISIRPQSKEHPVFKNLAETLREYNQPVWLSLDKTKLEGKVLSEPKDLENLFDVNLVVDYYSK